jgi:hypothetical protein
VVSRVSSQLPALLRLVAAALGIGAFTWFVLSNLQPLAYADRPLEYVFIGASPLVFAAVTATAVAGLAVVHLRAGEDRWSAAALGHLTPLAILVVALLAAVVLIPQVGDRLSVLTYVLVDLRVWWSAALVALALIRFDRARGYRWRRRIVSAFTEMPRERRLFALDAALFVLVLVYAIFSSPYLRFSPVLHGDEPKYLRLCENFYQGLGLDVSHQQRMEDLGLAYRPPLTRNLTLFAEAVREDARYLAADARTLVKEGLGFQFNRAQFVDGWFLRGRNGAFYQVHNPGLSFILFPAYFLDRHFFATRAGYQDVFPIDLPATNLLIVLLWSAWSILIFRLLRAWTAHDGLAWILAAAVMLTMPVSAFGFQIYPEVSAGIIVCLVSLWLLFKQPDDGPLWAAMLSGAAVGFLPWLHVRFLLMSVVFVVWAAVTLQRRRVPFVAMYALLMTGLCLYSYHLTGSLRPDAMYETEGGAAPWRLQDALQSMVSYPLDRIWGFLPHAPVYLFALPGWWLTARRQPRVALLAALLISALVVPSAGHGFSAAGATPLRHLVAIVPLAMIPVGAVLIAWGDRRWVRVAFVILLVVSLDAALSYNLQHHKETGRLIDWGASGWAPNLLLPWTHGIPWQEWRGTFVLFLVWVALVFRLLLLPLTWRSQPPASQPPATLRHYVAGVVMFIGLATGATALGGEWTRSDYFIPVEAARAATIDYAAELDRCRICYSSVRGEVGRGEVVVDSDQTFEFTPLVSNIRAGEEVAFEAAARVRDGLGWGTLAIDFGDEDTARMDLRGSVRIRHAYVVPGEQRITARFTPNVGVPLQRTAVVTVVPASVAPEEVPGLPPSVRLASVRGVITRIELGPSGIAVYVNGERQDRDIWLLRWAGEQWIPVDRNGPPSPSLGKAWVAVLAASGDGSTRTPPVLLRWPEPQLTVGAPVVLYATAESSH